MKTIDAGVYKLNDCGRINVIFGKNGCGKSTALKNITQNMRGKQQGLINYITPERGGVLTYESSIEQSMGNPEWKPNARQANQAGNFRQQSVVVFKDLQSSISNQLQSLIKKTKQNGDVTVPIDACEKYMFDNYILKINSLLDNVEIRSHKGTFKIFSKSGGEVTSDKISSGESELITLAIECLAHDFECNPDQENVLFLDEPDVHIHPDLQAKLMHFLKELVETKKFIVVLATHSTAIIGALEDYEHVHFEFMKKGQEIFAFKKVLKEYKSILPIFGAHPLSNIYCSMPIFLVEGEDDVWIWQKAIRTSGGKLKIFPCATDGVSEMAHYEKTVSEIITSIYDAGSVMGYSLRDRDDAPDEKNLDDFGKHDKITRFMLGCRCAENLFLTDQVLIRLGTEWDKITITIDSWLQNSTDHPAHSVMQEFKDSAYNRKNFKDIKEIMNILVGMITNKPWQVVVGQEIGELVKGERSSDPSVEHSLANYLGNDLVVWLKG